MGDGPGLYGYPVWWMTTGGNLDEMAKQAGLTVLPLDVWIDSDQRVRKLAIDLEAKPSGDGAASGSLLPFGGDGSLEASLVVELYDYGQPLDLELPPADQVADAATLKPATLPSPSPLRNHGLRRRAPPEGPPAHPSH